MTNEDRNMKAFAIASLASLVFLLNAALLIFEIFDFLNFPMFLGSTILLLGTLAFCNIWVAIVVFYNAIKIKNGEKVRRRSIMLIFLTALTLILVTGIYPLGPILCLIAAIIGIGESPQDLKGL